jgi:hypothetical protein
VVFVAVRMHAYNGSLGELTSSFVLHGTEALHCPEAYNGVSVSAYVVIVGFMSVII